jgi:DNA-binding PadR family transcriptional regulator
MYLNNYYQIKEIRERTGLSKRQIEYSTHKLIQEGLVDDVTPKSNKYKVYKITESGKSFLAQVRTTEEMKKRVINENVRAKCEIHNINKIQKLIDNSLYNFKENPNWKNSKKYYGKINNHTIEINIGKDSASMVLIAPKRDESSGLALGYYIIQGILETCYIINEKWDLGLGVPELFSGEYIVYTPYAQAMMRKTIGKQVKGKYSLVNQSAPFIIPHQEFKNPLDVDKMLQTPYDIEYIKSKISNIDSSLESVKKESAENTYNFDSMKNIIGSFTNSISNLVNVSVTQSSQISEITKSVTTLAEKLTNLMDVINKPNQQNSSQEFTKQNPDVQRMFG